MNKNNDAVPAGVAALYANIVTHTPEKWRASGSELGYLDWVESEKTGKKPEPGKVYKVCAQVQVDLVGHDKVKALFSYGITRATVSAPVVLKVFTTKEAAEIFIAELEALA